MKNIRSILMVGIAGLALAAGLAFAQTQGAGTEHGGMRGHFRGGDEFGMFLHQVNLTDEQKAQVKQIFQNEKPNMKPLMQQEGQIHLQMMKLVTGGSFEQQKAAISSLTQQEAGIHAQMEMEHAKIGAQIYQLLNSDQKTKVADLISQHEQRMQERMQNNGTSATPEQ